MLWSVVKARVRRSILNDPDSEVWSDEMLLDYAGWTLDAISNHTALLKTVTYTGDGDTYQHTLPTDVYLSPDKFGLVYRYDATTAEQLPTYLYPAYSAYDISPYDERAFTVWPADTLETGTPTPSGVSLILRYYARWPHPEADDDDLLIPSYLEAALCYGMGVHALTWRELEEADVGSVRQKPDLGQPEQNAYRQTSKWWIQRYDRELAIIPPQEKLKPPRP